MRINSFSQFVQKFTTTVLLSLLGATFLGSTMIFAQPVPPAPPGQPAICRNDRDWGIFISAVISYDDFVEYWKDILVRYNSNICHYQDIDALLKSLSGVREQIRKAFFSCGDTAALKKRYHELDAEVFFLRKYLKTENGQFLITQDQQMLNDLREYFVINKGFFSEAEIKVLFDRFKRKYEPRLEVYKNCKDMGWQALTDKWNEFKETVGGIGPALKQASKGIEKKWDRMANTSMNLGRDFFGGFLDVRVNGLPVKEGFQQITDNLKANFPQGYTFEQLQTAQGLSNLTFEYQQKEVDYAVQYQSLYKETSDEFTELTVGRLMFLNQIIKSTYPYQNQTMQCVKSINNKQC